jgi:UDP-N-acetylmuramate dehydrogenase
MSTKFSKSSESNTLSDQLRERFGERIQENCSLAPYVKSGVGGVAEYLFEATTAEEIAAACHIAWKARRPFAVLGAGTGTVASHVGALGLVVINRASQIHFSKDHSLVVAESGATNASLIAAAASRGLGGLEFLIGIPGTVGGAVATKATYQGRGLQTFLRRVVVWFVDGDEPRVVTMNGAEFEQCEQSVSAQPLHLPRPVVLAVHLQFSRLYPDEIMRRLRGYAERSREIHSAHSVIGHPFWETLTDYPLLAKDMTRVRQGSLRYDSVSDIVRVGHSTVQPEEIRSFLATLKRVAQLQGVTLALHLSYLGYWPDEGANEQN